MGHDLLLGCPLGVLSFGEKRVSIKKIVRLNSFQLTVEIQTNEFFTSLPFQSLKHPVDILTIGHVPFGLKNRLFLGPISFTFQA